MASDPAVTEASDGKCLRGFLLGKGAEYGAQPLQRSASPSLSALCPLSTLPRGA